MMIADFEDHAGSILAWPFRSDIWRENAFPAQRTVVELAETIARFEPVIVLATTDQYAYAKSQVESCATVIEISYDDIWLRDTAPIFLKVRDHVEARCFRFNAWGGIYSPFDLDDQLGKKLCDIFSVSYVDVDYILEGGSVVSNGRGTIITTEECILNPNRNGNMPKNKHEAILRDSLCANNLIWLPRGLQFDETSGHVDEICCFVDHDHVLVAWTDDRENNNYDRVREALDCLERAGITNITKMPLPEQIRMTEEEASGYYPAYNSLPRPAGELYATSYLNFIFTNGGIIVPQFEDSRDQQAVEILESAASDRKVVPIYSRELVLGGGSFHCIVKELPAKILDRSPLLFS